MDGAVSKLLGEDKESLRKAAMGRLKNRVASYQNLLKAADLDVRNRLDAPEVIWGKIYDIVLPPEEPSRIAALLQEVGVNFNWTDPQTTKEESCRTFIKVVRDEYNAQEVLDKFKQQFDYWASRMKWDAEYARELRKGFWSGLFFAWNCTWSWALGRKQRELFEKSADPMLDYPEEVRPFVTDTWYGHPLMNQVDRDAEFDRLWEQYKADDQTRKQRRGSNG